ncbi:PilN family type IVB pilus formation outer membrane protein [Telmatospirillum siberiense]|uniref:PilN family type IVB pilus formation outer membrane protein n=1 Tax=Telmatospirillum siberiense TaxID=382514 RepID=A0A2N3PQZ5_9PROT|nr:PilN family type IVB pilus formation outer membrane protein [Telmatospirillum siberiense]PKU22816.1 PilN family type IVB pilus formation outer membrane protein [Telmatospirillum siberiense]
MTKGLREALVLASLLFPMAACQVADDSKAAVHLREKEADDAMAKAVSQGGKVRAGTITLHDGIWVGGRSVVKPNGDALPAAAETAAAVVLNSMGASLELREIAAEITAQTGVKVVLEEHLDLPASATIPAPEPVRRTNADGPPAAPSLPVLAAARQQNGMALAWSGPLSGLLDSVSTYFGLQWEYRGGQVRIFRHEIRTFTLAALPSNSTIRSGVNTSGSSSSANGGSTAPGNGTTSSGSMLQDTSHEASIKLWDDIKEAVQAMLPGGAKATMSPATGTLTVIAPPLAMRRIASYVEQQNRRITRQVTISVKVLRVDVKDTYDLGLDLSGVFQQLSGQYAVNLAGPAPLKVTSGTAATYLVQAIQNTQTNKGQWATGSSLASTTHAAIDALQTMGKVTLMTETSVTTLNGQVAPVSVAEQQSYVASTATTIASGTNSTTQTQITPATLVTGFNMQVLPRVLDDGQILLQYGLSLSDLKALTEFDSNGTKVQLPDVNIRSFLQQAIMRSGDLLVLAGYQSTSAGVADTGLPGIGPSLLGGSIQTEKGRSVIVIMMAPEVLARAVGETL